MGDLNWTDDQWRKVKDAVTEAFGKASVASAFLPLYGPLSGGTETVRNERLLDTDSFDDPLTLDGDHDAANLKLINVTVKVKLSSEQVARRVAVECTACLPPCREHPGAGSRIESCSKATIEDIEDSKDYVTTNTGRSPQRGSRTRTSRPVRVSRAVNRSTPRLRVTRLE